VAAARGDGVAIVLSGADTDGTLGARAVKQAGGLVFVQAPDDASHPTMPRSVLATGVADGVAAAAELACRLGRLDARRPVDAALAEIRDDDALPRILALLRRRTGHDFAGYKTATLMRRVARRMQVTHRGTVADYAAYLEADADEARALFDDLTISVTTFFRDAEACRTVRTRVLAGIVEQLGDGAELRVWVVGCATGEEAYSLAIAALEELHHHRRAPRVQIFATDIDERALAVAREGRYPKAIEADVPDELLRRYFTADGDFYRVKPEVRDRVLFAAHSVVRDPPFLRLDLISCRNLLIYLDRELQRQLQELFHYALKPGGYLFLGSAETVDGDDRFELTDRDARLYRARPKSDRALPELPRPPAASRPGPGVPAARPPRERGDRSLTAEHLDALEREAPASLLVDDQRAILHLSRSVGRFLLPAGGPFSADATALVRPELQSELRRALDRAFEQGEPTLTPPLAVAFDGGARRTMLHVAPTTAPDDGARRALVLFLDGGPVEAGELVGEADTGDGAAVVRRLRADLDQTQERLQTSRQEHYDTVQELRATNEELHSINEEYRSTSEELTTSKEELQSMNEELQTVNAELRAKLDDVAAANSDLQNLIQATDIGTLFLDTGLRIRLFTPKVAEIFNVAQSDVGRAITDFTHQLVDHDLEREAAKVLRDLAPLEQDVTTTDGDCLRVRMRPYRTIDDRIDGLVLTFVDVTGERAATARVSESEAKYRSLFESMSEGLLFVEVVRDAAGAAVDLRFSDANPAAVRMAGLNFVGKRLSEISPDFEPHWLEISARVERTGEPERHELSAAPYGKWFDTLVWKPEFAKDRVALLALDVTDQRRERETLRQTQDLLKRAAAAAGFGWATCDLATGRARWDERSRALIGLDAPETALDDWLARIHADDRPTVQAVFERCARTGEVFDLTYRVVHLDGAVRRIRATGVFPLDGAGRRGRASALLRDVTAHDRAEAERQGRVDELGRRLARILPAVQSLAAQAQRVAGEGPAFKAAFDRRLQALAAVQDLLVRHDGGPVPVAALALAVRATFGLDQGDRVVVDGPAAALAPDAAVTAALVLHELGADAVAHGALATPEGRVEVGWDAAAASGTSVTLHWVEHGATAAAADRLEQLRGALERGFADCRAAAEPRPDGARLTVALGAAGAEPRPR
jgi:two-component system CheB/CheR fusion protein